MAPPTALRRLTTIQESRANELSSMHARLRERDPATLNRNILEVRLQTVKDVWTEARKMHEEIIVRADAADSDYITNSSFAQMTITYEDLLDDLVTRISHYEIPQGNALLTPPRNLVAADDEDVARAAKLPKLDLPTFSGDYEDWDNFCDLFTSLVHNSTRLSNVAKLQFLKSCLKGSASEFIKDVATTNANYLSTWQALKARFANPRLTVNNLLNALLNLEQLKKESGSGLRAFIDETQRIVRALNNLKMPIEHWDVWLVHLISNRLDPDTRKHWEAALSAKEQQAVERAASASSELNIAELFPKYTDFVSFLEQRARALGMIDANPKTHKLQGAAPKSGSSQKRVFHASAPQPHSTPNRNCPICAEGHYLGKCPSFLRRSVYDRRSEARRLHRCFNCLGPHRFLNCESKRRCSTCRGKHHTLLHSTSRITPTSPQVAERNELGARNKKTSSPTSSVKALTLSVTTRRYPVILATAQVILVGPSGIRTRVRALLDQGSEASLVSESVVQLLGLTKHRARVPLSGLGASTACTARSTTTFTLFSICDPNFILETQALVLPKLTSQLPSRKLMDLDLSQFNGLSLADPDFHKPDSIDLILGAETYGQLLKHGLRRFASSRLVAQDTVLGWVVSGSMFPTSPRRAEHSAPATLVAMNRVSDDELQRSLQRFWEVEEVLTSAVGLKPDDEACEKQFQETHSRESDGRYIVRLPLRSRPRNYAVESRRIAMGSLSHIHRRFFREPQLASAYRDFMKTYEELGHMERIPEQELATEGAWYLPHHAVVQTTPHWKLRIVFDASRRARDQRCLNEFLRPGPPLQSDLSLVLLNWQRYRFAFTADIVKMFRQIRVHPEDQDFQRILWTPNPGSPPVEYRLTTVTYGTACAPYLAIRTLLQLAQDEQQRFSLGSKCLKANTYVDDTFSGAHEIVVAIQKRDELRSLLRTAGIELDKWAANSSELLPIPSNPDESEVNKQINLDETVKTLGVRWMPARDSFGFTAKTSDLFIRCTKRTVLSNIARLYDPLGWLTPVVLVAKIIMQDLWILKIDWDSQLPEEIRKRWQDYCSSLVDVTLLSVDRWLGTVPNSRCVIHGFADASSRAYAAVIYLRIELPNDQVRVSLLSAKSKLSPVKTLSIPYLELNGAALLVTLIRHIRKLDYFKALSVVAWSDSQIVLGWLRKHPCHWKVFVANRVSLIQTELPSAEWRHVPTKQNPADLGSRGATPAELRASDIWWHGPRWLSLPPDEWPRDSPRTLTSLHAREQPQEVELLKRFSSLTRLIRVVAYCRRPLCNLRRRRAGEVKNLQFLTAAELSDARLAVIRMAQATAFSKEIRQLTSNKALPNKSPLRKLNPFVAEDGILRVGGRLSHSNLSREAKHPPILPFRSKLSRLFTHQAHLSSLHGGPTLTLSVLQQHVWVLGRNRLVKTEVRNCIKCQRIKPRVAAQLMANLPAARVIPSRPFTTTGLDYAGPIQVRTTKGRGHRSYKGYIALFICFATRAIHLELVGDLTTTSFLAAYRRFAGRRGICRTIYSDNATTFQSAAKELRAMFDAASTFYREVASTIANDGTSWVFIPPNTPHCGGLWEAGVKSTKYHLRRVIGEHTLTFEELSSLLVEIEVCLNSRPLYPMSSDIEDLQALTPAHFLIGTAHGLIPDEEPPNVPQNRLSRFHLLQRIRNQFWNRWSVEYLHHLQERGKWRCPSKNFAPGELVLLRDDRYPPSKWPLGRITEVHPGPDGLVRVATIKMATSTLQRHISRLCPLSFHDEKARNGAASAGGDPVRSI